MACESFKTSLGIKDVSFATEDEVFKITGGVLVGGVPPFGSVFTLKTFVDQSLLENEKIIFNCADRTISVGILCEEFLKIEKPTIVNIT